METQTLIAKVRKILAIKDKAKRKQAQRKITPNMTHRELMIANAVMMQGSMMIPDNSNDEKHLLNLAKDWEGGVVYGDDPNNPIISSWQSVNKTKDIFVQKISEDKQAKCKDFLTAKNDIDIVTLLAGKDDLWIGILARKNRRLGYVFYSTDGGSLVTRLVEERKRLLKRLPKEKHNGKV